MKSREVEEVLHGSRSSGPKATSPRSSQGAVQQQQLIVRPSPVRIEDLCKERMLGKAGQKSPLLVLATIIQHNALLYNKHVAQGSIMQ